MINLLQNISPTEYAIIALILIVLFGAKITKFLARTSGETVKEINKFKREFLKVVEDEKPSTHS